MQSADYFFFGYFSELVEPPSPQEFAPLPSQAVGGAPRPPEITPSHDMYLSFARLAVTLDSLALPTIFI